MSRATGVDVITGAGLDAALDGVVARRGPTFEEWLDPQ
jgi:hypothetical protein